MKLLAVTESSPANAHMDGGLMRGERSTFVLVFRKQIAMDAKVHRYRTSKSRLRESSGGELWVQKPARRFDYGESDDGDEQS